MGMTKATTLIAVALLLMAGVANGQSVEELQARAERGDAEAQYELGEACAGGSDIPQNYRLAVQWYKKAAEQGHAEAQGDLGWAYYNGNGVEQDYTEAYTWANLARVGLPEFSVSQTFNQSLINITSGYLTQAQIQRTSHWCASTGSRHAERRTASQFMEIIHLGERLLNGSICKISCQKQVWDSVPPTKQQEIQICPVCSNAMKASS